MIHKSNIEATYSSIKDDIFTTPLIYSSKLSEMSGANVYLKMEHLQRTDSFKIRGVLSKINSLVEKDLKKELVAASTGNHAAAFSYASQKFGFKGKLFLPKTVAKEKLANVSNTELDIVLYGNLSTETEAMARLYAKNISGVLIHPYNDIEIIKGQGTIALEIHAQLPKVDTIISPIGGGGLISGICSYYSKDKNVNIIGCQPEKASEMFDSIRENKIVVPSTSTTIADAAMGGIEKGSLTFTICKKLLSDIILIDEEAIKKAIAFLYKYHDTIIEPTAALPVAALLKKNNDYRNKNVVLILTGNKINQKLLTEINTHYGNCY